MSEKYEIITTFRPEEPPEESAEFIGPGNIRDLTPGNVFEFCLINSETGGKRVIRCVFKEIFKDMASGDKIRLRVIDCGKTDDLVLPLKDFESGYSPKIVYRKVKYKNLVKGEKYFFDYIDDQGNPRIFSGLFVEKSYFEKEGKDYFCFKVGTDTFYCSTEEFGEFKFRSIVSVEEEQEITDFFPTESSDFKGLIPEKSEQESKEEILEVPDEPSSEVEKKTDEDEPAEKTEKTPEETDEENDDEIEEDPEETDEENDDEIEEDPEENDDEIEEDPEEPEEEIDEKTEDEIEGAPKDPEEPVGGEVDSEESVEEEVYEYQRDLYGISKWIEDRFRKTALEDGVISVENGVATVEALSHFQMGLLLTSLFRQFPDVRNENIKFSYDKENRILRMWEAYRTPESLTEDDHVKAYALAVENKDKIEADWRKDIVLQDLKIKSRRDAENLDFSNEEARSKFLGDSIMDFLNVNSEVVETRIASQKEKSEKEGTSSGFGKLFGKMKNFVSGVADKWKKAKWPVKFGILGAAAVGGAFVPVAAPWLGLGVMGLGAAALQPIFRDIGYRGFKRGGRFLQLGDYSVERASAYSARMGDSRQDFGGRKDINIIRSESMRESYRKAIEERIAQRFGNKNSEVDLENPSEGITSIMTEEYNKVFQKIENMHYRLAYRRVVEFGAAFGTIAAFGYGVKAAVGGVLSAIGSSATEAAVSSSGEVAVTAPEPVPADPDAIASTVGEEATTVAAPVEADFGAEVASITPDAEFVGNFHSVGHPDVYDPAKTLIQYDASDLSQVNSAVNPVAGTEVEISTRSGNLNYRTGTGEILNSLPRGTDLTLTGETKVFEVTSKFDSTQKVLATFFEAVDANGNRGYFAGSYLQVK